MSSASDPTSEGGSPILPGFLLDPVGLALRRWKWMVAALAFGLAATGLFARSLDLTYLATRDRARHQPAHLGGILPPDRRERPAREGRARSSAS